VRWKQKNLSEEEELSGTNKYFFVKKIVWCYLLFNYRVPPNCNRKNYSITLWSRVLAFIYLFGAALPCCYRLL